MAQPSMTPRQYERSRLILVGPDAVYDYISDVTHLPTFLPTLHRAEPVGDDRVRMEGEAAGHPYAADGYLRTDPEKRRLEWGSDDLEYHGSLVVSDEVGKSRVFVRLTFTPGSDYPQRIEQDAPDPDPIDAGLEAALDSIKNILEGEGGKVEPPGVDD